MILRGMFKKTYTKLDMKAKNAEPQDAKEPQEEPNVPEGLWRKCNKCGRPVYSEDVIQNFYVCPKCKGYFRVHAYRRFEMIADEGSFEEWDAKMEFSNPLDFPGYEKKFRAVQEKTNLDEAVVTGKVTIEGHPAVMGVCDSRFFMSSMGYNVGEKITRAIERATKERLPVILYCCSGGARMQEGMVSLMQMAKTSAALKRHHEAGLLYITVLTDPTTGGVTASFAMLGDVILAEPGALIGFAGPRVIEQTIRQKLPEGFQRAEFLLEHGFVDRIVERQEQKKVLGKILEIHEKNRWAQIGLFVKEEQTERIMIENVTKNIIIENKTENTIESTIKSTIKNAAENRTEELENPVVSSKTPWDTVLLSRKSDRPAASAYIEALFTDFIEFHGDRYCRDDGAVIGGVALFHGCPVTVIGQEKGKNTKDNLKCNFGMPSPDGYRKALRLMKQAEKFGRPVICFVDTPGAFCGMEAEERGQGEAIARNLFFMSDLKVPILTIVIGEGGSGGALALAVADEVWMMENAIYSILSPEGFASILWKDSKKAPEAARVMKITAKDLLKMGMIEKVLQEKTPVNLEHLSEMTEQMDKEILEFLRKYGSMDGEALANHRYSRFRNL